MLIANIALNAIGISLYFLTGGHLFLLCLPISLIAMAGGWAFERGMQAPHLSYCAGLATLATIGTAFYFASRNSFTATSHDLTFISGGLFFLALAACTAIFGFIEYVVLRLLSLFRLGAIARVTYYEALLQPFTLIVLALGLAVIVVGAFFPFFTLSEDSKMYRDVAASFAFIFAVPIMIFASSKVIDEEIENRTMLTLMSKPVARWQVVLGKYLGVLMLVFVAVAALGIMAGVCAYLRYFDDMRIEYYVASTKDAWQGLDLANNKAVLALIPAVLLEFMQLATLAAISVAISTRYGLALNVTVIVILYIGANLTRYTGQANLGEPWQSLVTAISYLLPSLGNLDLNQRLIYGNYNFGKEYIRDLPTYSQIWSYVALAAAYSILYISGAISFAMALFRNRELT
jgi:ABC-type transport system involved in multi-copper enzyme maturation permease subunit